MEKKEMLVFKDLKDLQEWLSVNLLTKQKSPAVTGQSIHGFHQSVTLGLVKPFYEVPGKGAAHVRLYLRSDLEEYAKTKRQINKPTP